ncbi:phospho-sugar mutase [Ichthyobacterium seriolicida]|uniref:Phosphoglucomutase n=1 Tax=Ichthyobacterium seriolicida TaxID=242600 RepID=A0A1J1E0U8_9FLAO|nr:phospho-sugar mutase [Ichthyobacterium seriolicida]BAV94557.1 phosphoglucomutase [Ichthyobacterium seriolicida]
MEYNDAISKAKTWLTQPYDLETRREVEKLILSDPEELRESFYKNLNFGTGGIRGIMGVGTNRINRYTLGIVTQGLSNYLFKYYGDDHLLSVAVAYDCRNNSRNLAESVAEVLSANGVRVFIFDDIRPTPELSFAIRHLKCNAGIVITASHNPPEYNGYKVYWNDGAQVVPPNDRNITKEIDSLDIKDVKFVNKKSLITKIGRDIDDLFLEEAIENTCFSVRGKEDLKIVFTPIHGTATNILPQALERAGFTQVYTVEDQMKADGNFPTVKSPNPEEREALNMAISLGESKKADLIIGTDPDADRVGIGVRDLEGNIILLDGNQTGAVMVDFLLSKLQSSGRLVGKNFIAISIVTSDIIKSIADNFGVDCKRVFTGFKWIGNEVRLLEGKSKFIIGVEESYGYMIGDFLRDKDAVTSSLLICEIAAEAKQRGESFYLRLIELYRKYGYHQEKLLSITKNGMVGTEKILSIMSRFRNAPLDKIDGSRVVKIIDYEEDNNPNGDSILPKSNVIVLKTADQSKVSIRPSGTEPKIKFYLSIKSKMDELDLKTTVENGTRKLDRITKELLEYID